MKHRKDAIYEDKDYVIIAKGTDQIGGFEPSIWLDIIHIACQPLTETRIRDV